ncbi:hypothetical protein PAXRUDRAFT_825328 [Paxillus rubicundulus Ve08.2h10]|uniref:Uncharacterized protein n=1 Tax=Paxillus rubicundulus Ve08.2h10 TaxID=930991 RepID=A0A0D0E0P2_9AGAM|nr:hypothetical protein PAXRUDRAFT_825328 [Paxillus rubicundulus Ve08.2h10]
MENGTKRASVVATLENPPILKPQEMSPSVVSASGPGMSKNQEFLSRYKRKYVPRRTASARTQNTM